MSDRHLGVTIYLTAIIALVLTVLPLPTWFAIARPQFLVLTVLYWSTMRPRSGGLFLGWSSGLALDVFQGSLLGEHALALAFTTYLAIRLNLLGSGHALSAPTRWVHTLTGALIWPLVVGVMGRFDDSR